MTYLRKSRALAKVLLAKRCQTHWLTCARCLRDAVQRSDLPQLESGLHLMTAVRVHVDQRTRREYDRWQNPKGPERVYAWAYSSGHCRISHQVSSPWIACCSLTANWVTVLKIDGTWSDGEFEHLTSVSVWFSHYWLGGGWVWAPHSRGLGSSLGQRKSGVVGWSQSVPRSVLRCLHGCSQSLAHTPPPFCLLQLSAPTKTHFNYTYRDLECLSPYKSTLNPYNKTLKYGIYE